MHIDTVQQPIFDDARTESPEAIKTQINADDIEIVTDENQSSGSSGQSERGLQSSDGSSGHVKTDDPANKNDKHLVESKLAKHIAETLKDLLCYDETCDTWFCPKKGLWEPCTEKRAFKIIMRVLDTKMPGGYAISKLNNIKSFLKIYLLLDKWTNNRHLLPMANGVLDTKIMQLRDYTHNFRFNWQLPYAFNPDAKIDVIKCWLWDASDQDMESINIIRAFFKMALVGGDAQKFLELIGVGGTGKSTLIRLLVAFIGKENHAATDLKNLETNRFEAAALYGKRLALISDSNRYGGEVSVLKALTGGDPVRLEKKNQQQSGSFVFDGVVVITANEAIQTADYTSGLIRRRMPVNFNRRITDEDKAKWASNGGIESAMHKELPGLLNWVLSMTDAEVKAVIGGINGEMTKTQREHLLETNKLAEWLNDNTVIIDGAVSYVGKSTSEIKDDYEIEKLVNEKLYSNYERWSKESNYHPVAFNRFSKNVIDICELLKIKVTKDKKEKGACVIGIALRNASHINLPSPITKTFLNSDTSPNNNQFNITNDELRGVSDESLTNQPLDTDGTDEPDDISSPVKNTVDNWVVF